MGIIPAVARGNACGKVSVLYENYRLPAVAVFFLCHNRLWVPHLLNESLKAIII